MCYSQQAALRHTQLGSLSGQAVQQCAPRQRRQCPGASLAAECSAAEAAVKLPASHQQSSQKALQQLAASKGVNRESRWRCGCAGWRGAALGVRGWSTPVHDGMGPALSPPPPQPTLPVLHLLPL